MPIKRWAERGEANVPGEEGYKKEGEVAEAAACCGFLSLFVIRLRC